MDSIYASAARIGAGVSAAAPRTRTKARIRAVKPSASSGIGSPKTIGPEAIVSAFAATVVIAITGTALPICRLFAETVRPTNEATMIEQHERADEDVDEALAEDAGLGLDRGVGGGPEEAGRGAERRRRRGRCASRTTATPIASAATVARKIASVAAS